MFKTDPYVLANRIVEFYNKVNTSQTDYFKSVSNSFNAGFEKTALKIIDAQQKQRQLNDELKKGSAETSKLSSLLKTMESQAISSIKAVSKFAGEQAINALKNAGTSSIDLAKKSVVAAGKDQSTKQSFIARSGNAEVGTAMYEQFKMDAVKSGADVQDALKGSLTFMSGAENTDQIRELNSIAVRLNKLTPGGQNVADISNVLYGAIQGKTAPLSQFNIPATQEESTNLTALGTAGNIDGFIDAFNEILNKRGITEEALNTMMDAPTERWGTLMTNFGLTMSEAGQGALTVLLPVLDAINSAFESGAFQPIIDIITNGLMMIAQGFTWLITSLPAAWEIVLNSLSALGIILYNVFTIIIGMIPFILGFAAAWAVFNAGLIFSTIAAYALVAAQKVVALALNIAAIAQKLFNFVMSANPIGLIIALIIGLATALFSLAAVGGRVREVLSNAFGLIVDAAQAAVNFIIDVLNGAIRGINGVSGFFADLLGVETKYIPTLKFEADFSKVKKAGQDVIENFSMEDLQNMLSYDRLTQGAKPPKADTSAAYNFKQDLPGGSTPTIPNTATGMSMPNVSPSAPTNINTVDTVNNLENVGGTVDISSEDLKMMRDLAEMQAIQHFVTLTPTVQMTTGDINSGADLDTIVGHIGRKLEEEFVSTAQGVYT